MARTAMSMVLAMVLVTMLCARAMAQSDCTSVLISLSPCLNYITGNSSTPSSQCCTQLARACLGERVVRSSPQCLCQVLNGGGTSLGINVNQTQAIALPGACKVQTPPISSCNGASPAASPAGAPEAPSSPSGTGSKTVPSTQTDGTSGASSIKFSIPLLLLLFSASYVSAFTKIF
ncbi:non-specific lipid-transfer protein [Salix suchowensis]|nr:non-specific lipid-transfer protein [Salix suchowensis]